jgi:hypothetical protein
MLTEEVGLARRFRHPVHSSKKKTNHMRSYHFEEKKEKKMRDSVTAKSIACKKFDISLPLSYYVSLGSAML